MVEDELPQSDEDDEIQPNDDQLGQAIRSVPCNPAAQSVTVKHKPNECIAVRQHNGFSSNEAHSDKRYGSIETQCRICHSSQELDLVTYQRLEAKKSFDCTACHRAA